LNRSVTSFPFLPFQHHVIKHFTNTSPHILGTCIAPHLGARFHKAEP
jgi:hypothetical protein